MQDNTIEVPADLPVTGTSAPNPSEPAAQPEKETSSAPGTEQTPQTEPAESAAEADKPAEADKDEPKDGLSKEEREAKRVQQRFDRLTRERYHEARQKEEARREAAEYRAELERLRAQANGTEQPNAEQSRQSQQQDVWQAAREIRRQEVFKENCEKASVAGFRDFPDWQEKADMLNAMGAVNPVAINIIADTAKTAEVDTHRVLYELAKNPDETLRIFNLAEPHLVGAALTRFAHKISAPKPAPPVSTAPRPVKPISGAAKVDPDLTNASDSEWYRNWVKQQGA